VPPDITILKYAAQASMYIAVIARVKRTAIPKSGMQ
jgi:hypothetical protein